MQRGNKMIHGYYMNFYYINGRFKAQLKIAKSVIPSDRACK